MWCFQSIRQRGECPPPTLDRCMRESRCTAWHIVSCWPLYLSLPCPLSRSPSALLHISHLPISQNTSPLPTLFQTLCPLRCINDCAGHDP